MRIYFLSDTGRAAVSCDDGKAPEIKTIMAACGYWQASAEQYKERVALMRMQERLEADLDREKMVVENRRYHAE